VVKINSHGGKIHFFLVTRANVRATRANFRAGYACTGNTLI